MSTVRSTALESRSISSALATFGSMEVSLAGVNAAAVGFAFVGEVLPPGDRPAAQIGSAEASAREVLDRVVATKSRAGLVHLAPAVRVAGVVAIDLAVVDWRSAARTSRRAPRIDGRLGRDPWRAGDLDAELGGGRAQGGDGGRLGRGGRGLQAGGGVGRGA